MKRVLFFILGIAAWLSLDSQSLIQPNYGLKSHETLEISKIEINGKNTLIYMSIENRIYGGSFCADKNIYLIYPDESRTKLISAKGIPACPDTYKFRAPGEKLDFVLLFPPLKSGTEWVDLVEECSENCFSFYGITLDNDLNKLLNSVFEKASKGKPSDNIFLFSSVLDSIGSLNPGIEGSLYINLINSAIEAGDKTSAGVWYRRLASSGAPRLDQYLEYLNNKDIKF